MIHDVPSPSVRIFIVVWLGQFVSLVGSGLTSFALGLWVYERTGSVTQFALIGLFTVLPGVILSPLAGALVDRWDRRWVMILSDTGAGFCTLMMALLFFTGQVTNLVHLLGRGGQRDLQYFPVASLFGRDYTACFEA